MNIIVFAVLFFNVNLRGNPNSYYKCEYKTQLPQYVSSVVSRGLYKYTTNGHNEHADLEQLFEDHTNNYLCLKKHYDVNFWREPGLMYRPIDFVISPKDQEAFKKQARKLGIFYTKVIDDVQRAFDKQTVMTYIRRQMSSMNWRNYFRLGDIYDWLRDLSTAYPQQVSVKNIGQSIQKRPILALRVLLPGSPERPIVMVEGGIHAREWISPAFVTYLIDSIVHSDTSNNSVLMLVAHTYDWYFVPVLNPDGYEYTHTEDRQWRKNCNGNGIDLNRNFAHAFGTVGASKDPAEDNYSGMYAFSEKESIAMSNFVKSVKHRLKYYLSFHSYGQYMVIPYADSYEHQDNFDEMYAMCKEAADKIASLYQTKYEVGTAFETVGYSAGGMSSDWVKKQKIPYVVTFELRDSGAMGFALPPDLILPTCKETLEGVMALCYPKSTNVSEIQRIASGQTYKITDQIVILVNVVLFIIARFD